MSKFLLTGCAAAALTLSAGIASAQDFKIKISGDAKLQAAYTTEKRDSNTRGLDFRSRFRMFVNPEAVGLDGALTYGANLRLRATNNDGTADYDRAYIYGSGAFGTVMMGSISTFSDDYTGFGNTTMQRPNDWISEDDIWTGTVSKSCDDAYGNTCAAAPVSGARKLEAWREKTVKLGGSNSSTRILYKTPFISGVQFATAYAPRNGDQGWSFDRTKTNNQDDAVELALYFKSDDKTIKDKFGDAILKVLVDYQFAKSNVVTNGDPSAFEIGLVTGYQGFQIGGDYIDFGTTEAFKSDAQKTRHYAYSFGAQYKWDAFVVGVGYNYAQKDVSTSASSIGKKTSEAISAGLRYSVSKGLDVFGSYHYVTNKNTLSNLKDDANVFELTTNISF